MKFYCKCAQLLGILTLFLATSVQAFEVDGAVSFGFPRGELYDYSKGGLIIGGDLRFGSSGIFSVSDFGMNLFADIGYSDLGLEEYIVPAELGLSDVSLNVATDMYLIQTGAGFSLEGKQKEIRPFCNFSGELVYYSNLSRIWSRNIIVSTADELFTIDGFTWRIGLSGGVKLVLWSDEQADGKSIFTEFASLLEAGYATGGRLKCMQIRSPGLLDGTLGWNTFSPKLESFFLKMGLALDF